MNRDHYPMYGVVLVAGAAVAVWAGMPGVFLLFLLFLACPLMMLFMMKGMGGMHGSEKGDNPTILSPDRPGTNPASDVEIP